MSFLNKLHSYGVCRATKMAMNLIKRNTYTRWNNRNAPIYKNPTLTELSAIEHNLTCLGIEIEAYAPPPEHFKAFKAETWFHNYYHGGVRSGVWDEKLLEHWIASLMLGLMSFRQEDIYIDIAASGSPWAKMLRERKGINAYAIDQCEVDESYRELSYYRVENATQTTFCDASVTGVSLHCAFEMFLNEDDINFIHELRRILKPGGKAIILPLYMHTHYCAYATPEYYGKGHSDPAATEYIRIDCSGVPSSRKYDADKLKQRILEPIEAVGMSYRLLALRNKSEFGNNIYCHFILEIER